MALPLSPLSSTQHPAIDFDLDAVLKFSSGVVVLVGPASNFRPLRCLHVCSRVIRQPCGAATKSG